MNQRFWYLIRLILALFCFAGVFAAICLVSDSMNLAAPGGALLAAFAAVLLVSSARYLLYD